MLPAFSFFAHRVCLNATVLLCAALCCVLSTVPAAADLTLLVPSRPSVEAPPKTEKNDLPAEESPKKEEQKKPALAQSQNIAQGQAPNAAAAAAAEQNIADAAPAATPAAATAPAPQSPPVTPSIDEEVDVLISMLRPFKYEGLSMDMPQLFAVLRYDAATPVKDGVLQPERHDLLGDIEEIQYLGQKAWGANVELSKPGLHQFIIEARPWWDAARDRFVRHYVKTSLPVYGVERGWEVPVGQRIEIVPLTRPFGLTAPALFSGRALLDSAPLVDAPVRMARINTDKRPAASPWHEELAARTDAAGYFSFVLNQPGWWACTALTEGEPLRGPDGNNKPLELGAVFWLYVDGPAETRKR